MNALTLSAVCYAAGYLTGLAAFLWMAWRRRLATGGILLVALAGLFGGLIGANLTQWLVTGSAGKTVLGAIAGGYLAVFLTKRALGLRRSTGDLFAVAISAGEAVGRWGCFFGGCCYGKPATIPWAIWQHSAHRHPTQAYLSLANLLILIVLLYVERRKPPENTLFYLQGVLYCIARFVIEFYRETHTVAGMLTAAQWACLGGLLFFGKMLHSVPLLARTPTLAEVREGARG